ncbi:DUF2256 domain-containing protein [bacterium]|nr:DUF2256 domain-containing protein [bacterium]
MKKKCDLPRKTCPVCERTFTWRKKWEKVWKEVKYCSKGCAQKKRIHLPSVTFLSQAE